MTDLRVTRGGRRGQVKDWNKTFRGILRWTWFLSLTEIEIPNSIVNVRSWAFSGCEKLERVELPKSLKQIDSEAFSDCIELKSIVIPSQVKQI